MNAKHPSYSENRQPHEQLNRRLSSARICACSQPMELAPTMSKFVLIDQSIEGLAGHHYEYAVRVLRQVVGFL